MMHVTNAWKRAPTVQTIARVSLEGRGVLAYAIPALKPAQSAQRPAKKILITKCRRCRNASMHVINALKHVISTTMNPAKGVLKYAASAPMNVIKCSGKIKGGSQPCLSFPLSE